ncbi:MAG: extracellular solute-binding protein [Lachnospiraceae bacterium]|nr:extracellular solute-binding protein [Lachnospiraceae bacterium]
MKKRITKLLAVTLASAMLLGGCGQTETPSSASTASVSKEEAPKAAETSTPASTSQEEEKPKEIVEITVMVYDRGREYGAGRSLTDNVFTDWVNSIMEPRGVHVTYVPVPRSGADNAVNVMLVGNTAPDVIRTYDRQRVGSYGALGGLVDLGPYLDRLDPDYLSKNADAIDWCKFDGAQYALPGVYAYHGKNHETYLRQDLVEGMGMEMPKTKEELIKILYAMKEKYPDITPYGFSGKVTDGKFTNFILAYTSRANERDNYIYEPTFTMVLKPGHKDGLRQLNQFVLDGIIDPDFATDTDDSLYDQNVANGKYGFIMNGSMDCINAYDTAEDPNYHMVEVDCIENLDGSYEVPSQDAFDHYVYVPKTAEDRIDAVMEYLNFLSTEEYAMEVKYGVYGYGSDLGDDGYPLGRSRDACKDAGTTTDSNDNAFLISNFDFEYNRLIDNYCAGHPNTPRDVVEGKYKSQYSNYYDKMLIGGALSTDEYVPLLQTLICEFVFKCMLAPEGQFDKVYEEEYQILLDNHLQEVLDERAAWYDKNH